MDITTFSQTIEVFEKNMKNLIKYELIHMYRKISEKYKIPFEELIKKCEYVYKNEDIPKLEVYRPIIKKPLLFTDDKNIFAIASDVEIEASIPTFDLNNINSITDYIIQKYKIS